MSDVLVPFITRRAGEDAPYTRDLRVGYDPTGTPRLGYVDETPADRDPQGVLWARNPMRLDRTGSPSGVPDWRAVHPLRQRATMSALHCQVCARPLPRKGGVLFLEKALPAEDGVLPVRTAQPPLCLPHARASAERCPLLRSKGHVALLATRFPMWGVVGYAYQIGDRGLQRVKDIDMQLPYSHPQRGLFLASQLVRELREYTVVDLDDLTGPLPLS